MTSSVISPYMGCVCLSTSAVTTAAGAINSSFMSALLGDVGNGLEATSIAQRVAGTFS